MEISIGRDPNSAIVLPAELKQVSRNHAVLIGDDSDTYILKDLQSKNGTSVNGRRIEQTIITNNDTIQFGDHTLDMEAFWSQVKDYERKHKTSFLMEFSGILEFLKSYEVKKEKITKPSMLPLIIRFGLILSVLGVLYVYPDIIPDQNLKYMVYIGVGIFATGISTAFGRSQHKRTAALESLKLEYEDLLVCPKCHARLLPHGGFVYWSGKKKCMSRKCDAIYK